MSFLGVGAGEAALIFIITLIVVGPHRFPEVMRTAGRWYRMARAYSNEVMKDVRAAVDDIEREVKAETDDFQSVRELTDLSDELKDVRATANDAQRDTRDVMRDTERSASSVEPTSTTSAPTPPASGSEPRPIRPSQREPGERRSPSQLQSMAAASFRAARERTSQGGQQPQPASDPKPPSTEESTAPPTPSDGDAAPEGTFDPFQKQSSRRGPVHVRSETTEDTDSDQPESTKDGESA